PVTIQTTVGRLSHCCATDIDYPRRSFRWIFRRGKNDLPVPLPCNGIRWVLKKVAGPYQIVQRLWCNAFLRPIFVYRPAERPEINFQDLFATVKDSYFEINHRLMINTASDAENKRRQKNG